MQPKSRKELAKLFGYGCTRTFTRHLKSHNIFIEPRKLLRIQDQLAIYAVLGIPILLTAVERQAILPLLKMYCEEKKLPFPYS